MTRRQGNSRSTTKGSDAAPDIVLDERLAGTNKVSRVKLTANGSIMRDAGSEVKIELRGR